VSAAATVVRMDAARPEGAFSKCREVLRAGGVIVYPTETFYGLGADPRNAEAVRKLFAIKGRPADQPILLLIRDADAVKDWAAEVTPEAKRLMERFWPGPLTLVFASKAGVLPELTRGGGTIGLRAPGSEATRHLLDYLGTALTGTSANLSGRTSPETAEEAQEAVGGLVDLILDGGRTAGGKPSTVVEVFGEKARVVREGAIPSSAILENTFHGKGF
jgi:L-threonylcarbamoyladenylate synthase